MPSTAPKVTEVRILPPPTRNILIVDDQELMRRAVRRALTSVFKKIFEKSPHLLFNPVFDEAANGDEALAEKDGMISKIDWANLIMTDNDMAPGMGGLQMVDKISDRIRKGLTRQKIIIMLSGGMKPENSKIVDSLMEVGQMHGFLDKPFSNEALQTLVEKYIPLPA